MKLKTAINYMKAEAGRIDPTLLNCEVGSFAIDSREVGQNGLFFALSQPEYQNNGFNGEYDDSTRFAPAAINNGAVACVVRPDRLAEIQGSIDTLERKLILSDDVIRSLQRVAHGAYLEWDKPIVAITGSAGKTTAKEITATLLESTGRKVLRNIKNFNNGLGHPLTVLKLAKDKSYEVAVLEMGMSTPMHEIERLCHITPPDISVVLNVLPVHVEHLGSIENIAKAKAEIIEGMKHGGVAVLNADDPRVAEMKGLSKGETVTFGIDHEADVRASNIRFERFGETRFSLDIGGRSAEVLFHLDGKHNIVNALAAAAVGFVFKMSVGQIAEGLRTVIAPPQRGEVLRFSAGFTVINDSYNSNPSALLSMIETLNGTGENTARKIVVAGEMLELGVDEVSLHAETGKKIAESGIDILIGVRGNARKMIEAALDAGMENCEFASDAEQAAEILRGELRVGDLVLVKGSRGVRTEIVVEKLLETYGLEEVGVA